MKERAKISTDDIDNLIASLIEILKKEVLVYKEIRDIIIKERRILTKPSLDSLQDSNGKKETAILKAKLLEEGRGKIIRRIADVVDLKESDINISFLIANANADQAKNMELCQAVLRELLMECMEGNRVNTELIDFSLMFMRQSSDFLQGLISANTSRYLPSGRIDPVIRNGKVFQAEG